MKNQVFSENCHSDDDDLILDVSISQMTKPKLISASTRRAHSFLFSSQEISPIKEINPFEVTINAEILDMSDEKIGKTRFNSVNSNNSNENKNSLTYFIKSIEKLNHTMIQSSNFFQHEVVGDKMEFIKQAFNFQTVQIIKEVRNKENCEDGFKLVSESDGIRILQKGTETSAELLLPYDSDWILGLLLETSMYQCWLLGNDCKELTQLDSSTDLINISIQISPHRSWFKKQIINCKALRRFTLDQSEAVVYFESEVYFIQVVLKEGKMLVFCRSKEYSINIIKKFINFQVYADICFLDGGFKPSRIIKRQSQVQKLSTDKKSKTDEEKSQFCGQKEDNLKNSCNLRQSRPSIISAIQSKQCVDSDDLNDDDLLSDRQFKRLRENYQLCPVDQCKDKNGNWTKWVLERMDEAQQKSYQTYMTELKKTNPLFCNYSVNSHLRFLNSQNWDINKTIQILIESEKLRKEFNCDETTLQQIDSIVDMHFYVTQGKDKCGRPILWVRPGRLNPSQTDRVTIIKFMCYMLDYVCTLMHSNVDQFLMIYDMEGFSSKNVNFELGKASLEISTVSQAEIDLMQKLYPERLQRLLILNSGWFPSMIYNSFKPFMAEKQKQKTQFLDQQNALKVLLESIDLDQIPGDYGGNGPKIDSVKRQKFPPEYQ